MSTRSIVVLAIALTLALGVSTGCRVALTDRMPDDVPLDDMWSDFAAPLSADERDPDQPPFDTPVGPPTTPSSDAAPPVVTTDDLPDPEPDVVGIPDGRGTRPSATSVPVSTPAVIADPPPTAAPGCPAPPPPPPPRWDPSRDRRVDRGEFESGAREPDTTTPVATVAPEPVDFDPLAPDLAATDPAPVTTPPLEAPPTGSDTGAPSAPPASTSDDLGTPPLGVPPRAPLGPVDPTPAPAEADPPTQSPPTGPPSTGPAPTVAEDDPWGDPPTGVIEPAPVDPIADPPTVPPGPTVPPSSTVPGLPDVAPAVPGPEDDPWADPQPAGATPTQPKPAAPTPPTVEDDPWGEAPAGAAPSSQPPTAPSGAPTAGTDDDPWGTAPSGAPTRTEGAPADPSRPRFVSPTREGRAMEQVTRLRDAPGDPRVEGFPEEVVVKAAAWVALRDGPRPLVLVFYDNASRTSDRLAAEILPVVAAYGTKVDVVTIDRGPAAELDQYELLVVDRYLGASDDVPVTVVAAEDRRTLLARFGEFPAQELDDVLKKALAQDAAPPSDDLDSPPAAADGPSDTTTPDNPTPEGERTGFEFTAPAVERAREHAARLREQSGGSRLAGYPVALVTRADPKIALEPGSRPVVIVFYDDTSRASTLQAADILPVLVENSSRVDVVAIDVGSGTDRSEIESKVVRPYYPGTVPATVVLSARRAPVKLWFQRTSGKALTKAIDDALNRR